MVEQTSFRTVIVFLDKLGVYDVVLPFLLVFTIVFAIFEKTKILGVEKYDGKEFTKKNLNAMTAFVIAFFVIASTKLVAIISEVMSNAVLLLILGVSFLLLVGVFFGDKEFTLEKFPGWIKLMMIIMFIGIVLIFLNALDWLKYIWKLINGFGAEWATSIIFFVVILAFIYYIVADNKPKETKKESKDK
ncbi:hypothetical protein J4444_04680 [Candidatus Woesearchaeota archaeon]|nr:hypothetical protein [Candidatus Woesearchaeota archaeon]